MGRTQDAWERRTGRPALLGRQGGTTCATTRAEIQARRGPSTPRPPERTLERDQPHLHGGGTRACARDLYQQIIGDEEPEQLIRRFPQAGQNIVASTMLLRNMREPSNSKARHIWDEVLGLLHVAAAQQAESSASRHRGAGTEKRLELARN